MSAVKVKDPHPSGLEFYREIDEFRALVRGKEICVWYYEWLVYPTGIKSPEVRKKYIVADIPAVTRKGDPELIKEAVMSEDGQVEIEPAQYNTDVQDVIVTPEITAYSDWRNKQIVKEFIGARLGEDIIIGAINQSLMDFPVDVKDGHIIGT